MAKFQKRKPCNIYAIPLPDGTYAFGKQLHGGSYLAIEKRRKDDMHDIPDFTQIDFYVGVYNDVLTDCLWPKVANVPFRDDERKCPPNTYIEDQMKPGNYEIYDHKTGEIRKATKQECIGLEETAVWDRNHVVDRLMGIDTWTKICK